MSHRLGGNILMIVALVAFTLAASASGSDPDRAEQEVAIFDMALDPSDVEVEVGDIFLVTLRHPTGVAISNDGRIFLDVRVDEPLTVVDVLDASDPGFDGLAIEVSCDGEGLRLKYTVNAFTEEYPDVGSSFGRADCLPPTETAEEVEPPTEEETGAEQGGTDVPALEGSKLVGGWGHPDGSSINFFADGAIAVITPDGEEATGTFQAGPSEITIDVAHPLWEDCPPEPATFDWFINEEDGWLQLSPFPGDCFLQLAFFGRGNVGPDEERVWSPKP